MTDKEMQLRVDEDFRKKVEKKLCDMLIGLSRERRASDSSVSSETLITSLGQPTPNIDEEDAEARARFRRSHSS